MVEIRFHGRGGQGTVIASKILADAVFKEDKYVQAFPEFGVERRGAPVFAFIRIDDRPIYVRSKIIAPDHIIVVDPSLIDAIDVTDGLKKGGFILINSGHQPSEFKHLGKGFHVFTVDANEIAIKHHLGSTAAPIVNTAILGAVPRIFNFVKLASVLQSVREGVPVNPDDNAAAAQEAYNSVKGV
jgi:2-oxoacid:acceptor oxidoreductase gamma subunit (pyruvate/2-ketoisovalerate family)